MPSPRTPARVPHYGVRGQPGVMPRPCAQRMRGARRTLASRGPPPGPSLCFPLFLSSFLLYSEPFLLHFFPLC